MLRLWWARTVQVPRRPCVPSFWKCAASSYRPRLVKDAELEGEVAALAEVLFEQEALARATLDKGFPSLTNSPWFGPQQVAAAIQVVAPQLKENRAKVEGLLEETLLVQEALRGASPGVLERLLPKRLKQYEKGVLQKQ